MKNVLFHKKKLAENKVYTFPANKSNSKHSYL